MVMIATISIVVAATMSVVAWIVLRNERRRSAARVALLGAEIRDGELSPVSMNRSAPSPTPADLFVGGRAEHPRLQTVAVTAVGVFALCLVGALVVVLTSGEKPSPAPHVSAARDAAHAAPVAQAAPLELVRLKHERDAGLLTVSGVVRNPPAGRAIDHLAAVVLLFNADGGYISSSRAEVSGDQLAPGTETTFAVTVPNAANVGRYRVSFRIDDRVVPHVDRRS